MWSAELHPEKLTIILAEQGKVATARYESPSGVAEFQIPVVARSVRNVEQEYFFYLMNHFARQQLEKKKVPSTALASFVEELTLRIDSLGPEPYAVAPIRTKPHRTYDPIRDVPGPEGEHVPMVLANLSLGSPERWNDLIAQLRTFGKSAGLLEKVAVKRKGKKSSDPFQIHIGVGRFEFNIKDVGYGVSQALPILVDTILAARNSTLLLQQPEVHLHPRAQAELGSFLAAQASQKEKKFTIETHSDYLIDRIRMDVRDKKSRSIA
jgi:hypothetical protein